MVEAWGGGSEPGRGVRTARAAFGGSTTAILLCLASLAFLPQRGFPADRPQLDPPGSADSSGMEFDSFPVTDWDEEGNFEEFSPAFETGNWDSVLAAYDASVKTERLRRISPEFGLRYSKAEGVHLEGGASLGYHGARICRLSLVYGYDIGRERPTGKGALEVCLMGRDRLAFRLQGHSEIRPFGDHDPYGNTLLAAVAGYDARNYLLEREGSAQIILRLASDRWIGLGPVRTQHDPVRPVEDWHLFGPNHWMKENHQAEPLVVNGLRLHWDRRPTYLGETSIRGLIVDLDATVYGGSILGGDREYARLKADLWYTRRFRELDATQIRAAATLATGRAPRQALADLGGDAGLRAFPPRGYGTPDTLIGTSRLYTRLEYRKAERFLRRTRLPLIKDLNMKLVPFMEAGAVWGDQPILEVSDFRGPKRHEFLWDLGFGLRRDFDFSGILSYLQIDFAWPMGHRSGPVRIGVTLSNDGLD